MKVLGVDEVLILGECDKKELSLVIVNDENNIECLNQFTTKLSYEDIAKMIINVAILNNCKYIAIDKSGLGLPLYIELDKIISNDMLVAYNQTIELTHSIISNLHRTEILSGWGVDLEFDIICGSLKLKKGLYENKPKWVSFAMATGIALYTIINKTKDKEYYSLQNTVKNKLEKYINDNDLSDLQLIIKKNNDNHYTYSSDITDILVDVIKD